MKTKNKLDTEYLFFTSYNDRTLRNSETSPYLSPNFQIVSFEEKFMGFVIFILCLCGLIFFPIFLKIILLAVITYLL